MATYKRNEKNYIEKQSDLWQSVYKGRAGWSLTRDTHIYKDPKRAEQQQGGGHRKPLKRSLTNSFSYSLLCAWFALPISLFCCSQHSRPVVSYQVCENITQTSPTLLYYCRKKRRCFSSYRPFPIIIRLHFLLLLLLSLIRLYTFPAVDFLSVPNIPDPVFICHSWKIVLKRIPFRIFYFC
jgi:hypothetical protein